MLKQNKTDRLVLKNCIFVSFYWHWL